MGAAILVVSYQLLVISFQLSVISVGVDRGCYSIGLGEK